VIERLGIIRLSAIGDVIHAMPLAMALRRRYPDACITWVVQEQAAPLLEGHPAIDELLIFPRRADWAGWKEFRRRILACRFDATVDPQGNIKSGIVARLSGARIRCGLALRDCKERPNWFFNNRHGPHPRGPHGVDRSFAAGAPLDAGQGLDAGPDEWGLHATDEECAAWRQRCRDHGAQPDAPLISIGLSNPADARSWFTEHWVALMPLLRARGIPVVLNGMADVAEVARQLHGPGVSDLVGGDDLRGLLAQFESMARYPASALITTDSGPAHVAVAVGLPVVCLSGSQDPARTGPRSVSRGGSIALTAWEGLACAPCVERECELRPPTRDCMRNLLPSRVISALAALQPGEPAD